MSKIVAVDAGHGLTTPGKRTPDGEREWTFNKQVAESVIRHLRNYAGVKSVRLDDPTGKTDVPLRTRTNKANRANADILVSIHHNANTGNWGTWTGTETYYYPGSSNGRALARAIHPRVLEAYELRNRGIKTANFHMLRESRMPAILIEGGFMDSKIDIAKLRDNELLMLAGKKIAEGISAHLNLQTKANPQPPPGQLYKVQIGAFKNGANASQLAAQAKAKGFDYYIAQQDNLYKVQIGAYANRANAEAQANNAERAGFETFIVLE